jgi:glycosyltransferase involved in cell wall biosynthesis
MEAKLSTFNTARHFTYMSSLMRAKGLVEFVRAAIVTIEAHPDSVFHIAGEWWAQESGLQQEIEAIVADSEACGKFVFHGLVTGQEKERLLFETDVFVLPTYYPFEGHPNCVVEAMAAGCPVITTNHASLAETVVDRETGYIVEKKDSLALAVAIVEMIVDRQKFWEMRRASYERFQEKYTSSRSTGLLIQAFRRAIGDEGAQ